VSLGALHRAKALGSSPRKIAVTPTRSREFTGKMCRKPKKNQEKWAFFAFYRWRKRENHLFDESFRGF
jgi:hypothetical protein